jgi:two-component system sensor histidine kinase DesK
VPDERSANDRFIGQFTRPSGPERGLTGPSWWPRSPGEPRPWMRGGWKLIFPGVFLVYLLQTAQDVDRYTEGPAVVVGYAVLVGFSLLYLMAMPRIWAGVHRSFWWCYAAMIVLVAIEAVFAHEGAAGMIVYLVVLTVSALGLRSLPVVLFWVVLAVLGPAVVPWWDAGFHIESAITIPVVALAMFGFFGVVQANRELSEARAEVARLAAENERTRIARDLHDLLGHSLTTITVKAALARRLAGRDDERAAREIAEVEELSRQALAEVRAAVADYRVVTLSGELATGAELLRAEGIEARLPTADDVVAPGLRPLFGWVVREGLTNVVRHARASTVTVALGPTWIEIVDDGRGSGSGGSPTGGTGLRGLEERVGAAGGTLSAGPAREPGGPPGSGGWRLRVDAPVPAPGCGGTPDAAAVPA